MLYLLISVSLNSTNKSLNLLMLLVAEVRFFFYNFHLEISLQSVYLELFQLLDLESDLLCSRVVLHAEQNLLLFFQINYFFRPL